MKIITTGVAGTMESSDIIVTIEPKANEGIELSLESDVMQQFGKQIERSSAKRSTSSALPPRRSPPLIRARLTAPLPRAPWQQPTAQQRAPTTCSKR